MTSFFKKLLMLLIINYVDKNISVLISEYFLILPLTFMAFSFYIYKSNKNIAAFEAFSIGLFVDLISETYFGLNAVIFCMTTYYINLNGPFNLPQHYMWNTIINFFLRPTLTRHK